MNPLDWDKVKNYIRDNILNNYQHQIKLLDELNLDILLATNPYLLATRGFYSASKLINDLMDAFLLSNEEKLYDKLLEGLAVFVAEMTCGGHKSAAPGVDLEFVNNGIHYVVSVKPGPTWGNGSQQDKLEQDLKNAVECAKRSKPGANVQAVLGICYGKTKTSHLRGYLKIVGQNFWYLISENKELYTEIIEPIGYHAKEHNDIFLLQKGGVSGLLIKEFVERFCDEKGLIDWPRLVQFNSGNFDVDELKP